MDSDNRILTECHLDQMFVQSVFKCKPNATHSGVNVIGTMLATKYQKSKAFVIIDRDKRLSPYFEKFAVVKDHRALGLRLLKDQKLPHYCVQIDPAMEMWIFKLAEKNRLRVFDTPYSLGPTIESFVKRSKKFNVQKDLGYAALFNSLTQKGPEEFDLLREWKGIALK